MKKNRQKEKTEREMYTLTKMTSKSGRDDTNAMFLLL